MNGQQKLETCIKLYVVHTPEVLKMVRDTCRGFHQIVSLSLFGHLTGLPEPPALYPTKLIDRTFYYVTLLLL